MNDAAACCQAQAIGNLVQRLTGLKRPERNARRWRLLIFRWIYEVTDPRHALSRFITPVETRSAPDLSVYRICQVGLPILLATQVAEVPAGERHGLCGAEAGEGAGQRPGSQGLPVTRRRAFIRVHGSRYGASTRSDPAPPGLTVAGGRGVEPTAPGRAGRRAASERPRANHAAFHPGLHVA